jgi:hypothetical protein
VVLLTRECVRAAFAALQVAIVYEWHKLIG